MGRTPGIATLLLLTLAPVASRAQQWQPGTAIELVRRAAAHRLARDADTLLASWSAEAHGVVRFASVLDHGEGPVERVMKADELRVEVYGESPNRSKQIIVAWRDTTFLPTGIRYHRDHLGIVANDFGGTIRLGEGDEVRDLVHPLSPAGLSHYLFAVGDTLLLAGPKGTVRVVIVRVRPIDPSAPGTVGTLYLDLDRAALVRFRFTFTPASYRDPTVEDITVTLENALQENVDWLPWRQSIVIRRGIQWIGLPLRTVLRGDWTIDNYQLGIKQEPDRFTGPFIGGLRHTMPDGDWSGPIAQQVDALPATEADVASEQHEASATLGGRLLSGLPRLRLLARGISDLLHADRVEGITPALGSEWAIGGALVVHGRGGYGFSDHRVIGDAGIDGPLAGTRWSFDVGRAMTDVADVPTYSGVLNSLRTVVSGGDRGDYTLIDRATVGLRASIGGGSTVALTAGGEWSQSVSDAFAPIWGTVAPNPALGAGSAAVARAEISHFRTNGDGWRIAVEGGRGDSSWLRGSAAVATRFAAGPGVVLLTGEGGAGTASLPGYRSFVLGGAGSLPGVPDRSLGGRSMLRAEIAWAIPVALPTPPFPYSRYVRLPSTIGPFVAAGLAGGDMAALPWRGTGTIEPVAGARLDLWGPLIRLEGGVALRTGQFAFTVDVHPDWWPLM